MDNEQTPPQPTGPANPLPPASPAPQIIGPQPLPPQPKKSQRLLVAVLVLLLLLAGGGLTYWYLSREASDQTQTDTTQESGIPERLLRRSGNVNGVAIGYLEDKEAVGDNGSFFFPKASAQDISYSTVVFYKDTDDDGTDQLYMLDLATKDSTQLTDGDISANGPVFSSVSQKLAYQTDGCAVTVKDMRTGVVATLQTATDQICYTPLAWSPDGTRLAYVGVDNDLNSGTWGLITLYLHQEGTDNQALTAPEGFNSLGFMSDVSWVDDQTLQAVYVDKGPMGVFLATQLFQIDANDHQAEAMESDWPENLISPEIVGDTVYAADEDTTTIISAPLDDLDQTTTITKTSSLADFLVRFSAQNEPSEIVYLTGRAGSAGSFQLDGINLDNKETTEYATPDGFSAYLLDWGGNYDELLYMSADSGTSSIHLVNLITKTDTELIGDLPFIQ